MNQQRAISNSKAAEMPNKRIHRLNLDRIAAQEDFELIQRLFLAPGRTRAVIAFCPVEEGSGCSWVVSRTARALARNLTQSICLVDADFRAPSQHRNFALSSPKGFAQSICESVPVRTLTQQISGSNLWVLPAGGVFADPYRLLLADRVRARLEELRQEFDYVLIDTPAASAGADATLIGKWTDGVVLVVEAGATRHERARRVRENIDALGIPVIGAVLNKRTYPIPDFLYQKL